MSKIQDALKKLQSESGKALHRPTESTISPAVPIGEVRNTNECHEADSNGVEGRVVLVDREKLRINGFLAPENQVRELADQYRLIKRPIVDVARGKTADQSERANVVMVASALSGDGKTFTCINLSLSIAVEKEMTVLLVDGDVAKPHISELFGVSDQKGLLDLLRTDDIDISDAIIPTNVPGLHLLPAGTPDEMATELLASRRMERVVDSLSRKYKDGIVVFDSPPMLGTSEARVLSKFMGQVALVVTANVTPQQAVLESIENLDDAQAISLILNRTTDGIESFIYGKRRYGYGYGNGS